MRTFGYDFDEAHNRVVFQVHPGTLGVRAFKGRMDAEARKANRKWNVAPGHDVSVLVQPSCFSTEEMLGVRERMRARQYPGQVEQVSEFIRWDGRMHIQVDLKSETYGKEL